MRPRVLLIHHDLVLPVDYIVVDDGLELADDSVVRDDIEIVFQQLVDLLRLTCACLLQDRLHLIHIDIYVCEIHMFRLISLIELQD